MTATLRELVDAASAEDLPRIIGDLEAARARAWARLAAPPPARTGDAAAEDCNLDADEAARRLGMSRDWLYRSAAKLPFAVKIGRRVLFSARGLEKWNRSRAAR